MTSLYLIADQYLIDLERIETMELDDQTFADTLEGLSGDLEVKSTNIAMFTKNLQTTADAIKQAEQAMADRRKKIESKIEKIEDYLLENLIRCGIKKIDSPFFSISVRNNAESVIIDEEKLIPAEFLAYPDIPPPRPDKAKIKEAIKNGQEIAGAHLERKQSLQIK